MKRKTGFYSIALAGVLFSVPGQAAFTRYPPTTINLSGTVDIVKNPSATVPHYVPGTMTGTTTMRGTPIYADGAQSGWYPGEPWPYAGSAIVSVTYNSVGCDSRSFTNVPGTSIETLMLENTSDRNQKIYFGPAIGYHITFSAWWFDDSPSYSGILGTKVPGMYAESDYCFVPNGLIVHGGGTKYLTLIPQATYPVYVPKAVTAGRYTYNGAAMYIRFGGLSYSSGSLAPLYINSDIKVIRVCQISNVVNSNFDVVMGKDNQVLKESSFSFTCTGDRQQMYISAIATEGQADSADPAKLLLNPVSEGSTTDRPWVIGKAYVNTSGPVLTCKDTGSAGLIPFNNSDLQLPLKAKADETYNTTIKWAICANDKTKPGSYRGKTQVSVFTKL